MSKLSKMAARLEKMNTKPTRHDYDIGDWWNVADEAAALLREAEQVLRDVCFDSRIRGDIMERIRALLDD